jgi:hypothetical protein
MESDLQICHKKMSDLYKNNKTLKNTDVDLNDISRFVTKMGNYRFKEDACN